MEYKINFEHYKNNFSLPSLILSDLQETDAQYVKIILMIFGNPDKNYSVNLLSNLLSLPESTITNAISHWIAKGVLLPGDDSRQVVEVIRPQQEKPVAGPFNDQELQFLVSSMELIVDRPLTSTDTKTITYIYEYYRMPADVILMAIQYCVEIGKKDIRYIEKVCVGWYDRGIVTHTAAEEFLQKASDHAKRYQEIKRLFGISGRNLIPSEEKYIDSWYDELGFDTEVILIAFERTVKNTGKAAFAYMNKILLNWKESGYKTAGDITRNETGGKKPSAGTDSATFDVDVLNDYWNHVPKLD